MTRELIKTQIAPSAAAGIIDKPVIVVGPTARERLEDMYQVVLWNDDHIEAGYVVRCLIQVFGHAASLAAKIMFEAHNTGKAIAEVEREESARLHGRQLQSFGITCTVEKI